MRCGKAYGAVCYAVYVDVVMHDSRMHRPYLCVGSTVPSLDILLFAINLVHDVDVLWGQVHIIQQYFQFSEFTKSGMHSDLTLSALSVTFRDNFPYGATTFSQFFTKRDILLR